MPAFQATPLVIEGLMYFGTPYGKVFALDAATGRVRWSYDAHIDLQGSYGDFANRGVSAWLDSRARANAVCRGRIFFATIDARLIALDRATGEKCANFGDRGEISLTTGLRRGPRYVGEYQQTSPPAIVNDLVVVGLGNCGRRSGPDAERRSAGVQCSNGSARMDMASAQSRICRWGKCMVNHLDRSRKEPGIHSNGERQP